MKLQEKLNTMKKESLAAKPPEVASTMVQETENLIKSGIAEKAIKEGETFPDFALPDENGNLLNSKGFLKNGPLVVSFYRGVW